MAGDKEGKESREPGLPALRLRLREELGRIDEQLRALLAAMDRLQGLLDAVVAISREVELHAVLHRIVTTAMELVGARYGRWVCSTSPGSTWRSSSPRVSRSRNAPTWPPSACRSVKVCSDI